MAEEEKGGLIRCANCGAEFDAALPRCPYCGRMNVPAAEDEYMDHLEDIRTDLDDLEGLAGRKARERLKISARKILLTVLVLLAAAGLILFVRIRADRAEAEASRAEYLWQRDAFTRLDELYAARDWDGLEQAFREGLDADHEMYQYAHGTFCGYLMTLSDARRSLADLAAGDAEPVLALCDAAEVWKLEDLQGALK